MLAVVILEVLQRRLILGSSEHHQRRHSLRRSLNCMVLQVLQQLDSLFAVAVQVWLPIESLCCALHLWSLVSVPTHSCTSTLSSLSFDQLAFDPISFSLDIGIVNSGSLS